MVSVSTIVRFGTCCRCVVCSHHGPRSCTSCLQGTRCSTWLGCGLFDHALFCHAVHVRKRTWARPGQGFRHCVSTARPCLITTLVLSRSVHECSIRVSEVEGFCLEVTLRVSLFTVQCALVGGGQAEGSSSPLVIFLGFLPAAILLSMYVRLTGYPELHATLHFVCLAAWH